MKKRLILLLLIIIVLIQFVRPARNLGSAATGKDITHYVTVPDTIMQILKTSCYDCHSNHTYYPWYANINPVGLWLQGHINDGKRALNFSDVSSLDRRKLDHRLNDIAKTTEEQEMPLSSYTIIHTYAKLSAGQISLIKQWTEAARKQLGVAK